MIDAVRQTKIKNFLLKNSHISLTLFVNEVKNADFLKHLHNFRQTHMVETTKKGLTIVKKCANVW